MENEKGACGCGYLEYILNSEIINVVNCHCNMCREHNGSSFSTYAVLPLKSLEITKGDEEISQYKASTGQNTSVRNMVHLFTMLTKNIQMHT